MGKRKREILENIRQRIEFGEVSQPNHPYTNLKIKNTLDVKPNFGSFVTPKLREYKPLKIIEMEEFSTSSNDLYNTDESLKLNNQQEICEYSKVDKCSVGKHVILDYYKKGMLSTTLTNS